MPHVTLQTARGEICRLRCGKELKEFAMRWSYIASQRHRWAGDAETRRRHADQLRSDFRSIGLPPSKLRQLHGVVQVTVPESKNDRHWEANILPWEFTLATASQLERGDAPILVIRHLNTHRQRRTRHPSRLALIESAPGILADHYRVSSGHDFVAGSFSDSCGAPVVVASHPTEAELTATLQRHSPDVIHVAAVDNRGGRRALGKEQQGVRDGFWLSDASGQPTECRAERLATLLNTGTPNPLLVGFDCWDSGSRLAAMTVRCGAAAAVGFQFLYDEAVAETFF